MKTHFTALGNFADEAIAVWAQEIPDKVLVLANSQPCTAKQLQGRMRACIDVLLDHGIQPGDRVATILPNSPDMLVTVLAILRLGAVAVPIHVRAHETDVAHILSQAEAKIVVSQTPLPGHVYPGLCLGPSDLEKSEAEIDGSGQTEPSLTARNRHPDDLAILFYTSGSTGRPKGVMITHGALMHGIDSVRTFLPMGPTDRLGAVLPMTFDAGLNFVLSGLHAGATIVFLSYVFPRSLADDLARHRVTGLVAVPQIYHALARCAPATLPDMRFCASTGGRMDPGVVDELTTFMPRMAFTVMYGLTEAFRATALDPRDLPRKRGSIGRAIPHARVKVIREDGSEAADGEVGELVQTGPLLAVGYWRNPEATAERYRPAPAAFQEPDGTRAVFSGDLGWRDEEGFLYFGGRKDRLIKSRGYRIAPEQIEQALVNHAGTGAVHVLGVEDAALGQRIVAFLEARGRDLPGDASLKEALRPHLASFMIPDAFVRVPEFPLNGNGKPDGQALLKLL